MKTGLRIVSLIFYAFFLSACASTPVTAPTFEDGQASYDSRHYERAFNIWESLAKQGDVEAAFQVGEMYDLAIGVKQTQSQAAKWYKYAAERGHQNAQFRLASKYASGSGVKSSQFQAYVWYSICATRNRSHSKITRACDRSARTKLSVKLMDSNEQSFKRAEKIIKNWSPKPLKISE